MPKRRSERKTRTNTPKVILHSKMRMVLGERQYGGHSTVPENHCHIRFVQLFCSEYLTHCCNVHINAMCIETTKCVYFHQIYDTFNGLKMENFSVSAHLLSQAVKNKQLNFCFVFVVTISLASRPILNLTSWYATFLHGLNNGSSLNDVTHVLACNYPFDTSSCFLVLCTVVIKSMTSSSRRVTSFMDDPPYTLWNKPIRCSQ